VEGTGKKTITRAVEHEQVARFPLNGGADDDRSRLRWTRMSIHPDIPQPGRNPESILTRRPVSTTKKPA